MDSPSRIHWWESGEKELTNTWAFTWGWIKDFKLWSFLMYCDTHPSETDYWKRKECRAGTGFYIYRLFIGWRWSWMWFCSQTKWLKKSGVCHQKEICLFHLKINVHLQNRVNFHSMLTLNNCQVICFFFQLIYFLLPQFNSLCNHFTPYQHQRLYSWQTQE